MRGLLFAVTGLVVGLAAGCGPRESRKDGGPVEIAYWRSLTGAAGEAQDELVRRFNESHPDIHVTSEFQGDLSSLATKLTTAAVARSGPDVTQLGTFEIRTFAQQGLLADLSGLVQGERGLGMERWPGTIRAAGEVDGALYWLPFNVSVPVLYYNKNAFQEAGLSGPPTTWTEFYDYARRLTKRRPDGQIERAGVALWDITWPYLSIIWSEGGELTDRDYRKITLNDPVAIEVMSELQRLTREGAAVMPGATSGGHRAAFQSGRAAMILDSPAPFEEIFQHSVGFAPAVAAYPAGKAGRVYAPGGAGISMLATTSDDKRAAAWTFMRYLLSPESLAYYAQRSGYLAFTEPARAAAPQLLADPNRKLMHDSLEYVRGDFSVNMSPAVRLAFDEAFKTIIVGGADVRATLDEADARAEKEIETER